MITVYVKKKEATMNQTATTATATATTDGCQHSQPWDQISLVSVGGASVYRCPECKATITALADGRCYV